MIIFFLFFTLSTYAFDITTCQIQKSTETVKINLQINSKISIKNIIYKEDTLILPSDKYRDKEYYNIRILSKEFYLKLKKIAVENKCQTIQNKKNLDYKISGLKKLNSSVRVANVFLEIDKTLSLTAGIMKNKKGELWISWPRDFVFIDREEKSILDKKILDYYNKNK